MESTKSITKFSARVDQWVDTGHQNWCSVRLTARGLDFRVNQPAIDLLSFSDACDYTAKKLAQDWADWPLYLALSGGLDSELAAEVLLRNQIPFTPVIFEVENVHATELWFAKHWCWRNGIEPLIIPLTGEQFDRKVLPYLCRQKYCSIRHHCNLWLANYVKDLGGKLITGLAEINFDLPTQQFYNGVVDWPFEFFDPVPQPCGFFSYTPEVALAWINEFDISINEQYNKIRIYNVPPRPKMISITPINNCTPFSQQIHRNFDRYTPVTPPNWLGSKTQVMQMLQNI